MRFAVLHQNTADIERRMHGAVEALKHDLAKIRTGRAHPGLLDHIHVDYYGSLVPLSQVAQIGLGDARSGGSNNPDE